MARVCSTVGALEEEDELELDTVVAVEVTSGDPASKSDVGIEGGYVTSEALDFAVALGGTAVGCPLA